MGVKLYCWQTKLINEHSLAHFHDIFMVGFFFVCLKCFVICLVLFVLMVSLRCLISMLF